MSTFGIGVTWPILDLAIIVIWERDLAIISLYFFNIIVECILVVHYIDRNITFGDWVFDRMNTVGANWALRSNCIGGGQAQYLVPYVQMA